MTAGSRSSWRKGRLARCSRRDSPAPAPYPVRFVAANSAFAVFRFAKRRKPLCCRSSSPKVLRLSGSPLNHWARSQATPRPTVEWCEPFTKQADNIRPYGWQVRDKTARCVRWAEKPHPSPNGDTFPKGEGFLAWSPPSCVIAQKKRPCGRFFISLFSLRKRKRRSYSGFRRSFPQKRRDLRL